MISSRNPELLRQRFFSRVLQGSIPEGFTTPCWLWAGATSKNGYGQIKVGGVQHGAHVVSFALSGRHLPKGQLVRHRCHVKTCVQPDHLLAGTNEDNVRDRVKAGRQARGAGKLRRRSAVSSARDAGIRQIYGSGRNGITQHEVATLFGVSKDHVSRVTARTNCTRSALQATHELLSETLEQLTMNEEHVRSDLDSLRKAVATLLERVP